MENIRNWFKEGTSEKEKEVIESNTLNLETNDDNLDYEKKMHYAMKDLILALDHEDLEMVSKLFPNVDTFLKQEQQTLIEKRDNAFVQLEEVKQNLLSKKINSQEALTQMESIRMAKEQNDKRFEYLQPLAKDITDKIMNLYLKLGNAI